MGFPGGPSGKEPACQCRRHKRCVFDSWVWKIPCRKAWQSYGNGGQSYGFSRSRVWIESWTIKQAECQRIDIFELWCWRRLLRVPWNARRPNQFILKEISPECLEGMMLKLKLQYFGHLMQRVDSLEKTDAGRDCGQEEKGTTEDEMAGWHH